jgi:3-oxoacyl-[acyl-carrier protein] reductase
MNSKVAVITGGSEGLGKHIALELIQDNITVILLARTQDKLKKTTQEIRRLGGASPLLRL